MRGMIYLDYCATTPLDPRVADAMKEARDAWGNPSSVHAAGRKARAVINEARAKVARRIGASPAEIVFTGSASEANNLAIKGAALRAHDAFKIVVSEIEHESVLNPARYLAGRFEQIDVIEVDPDSSGVVRPSMTNSSELSRGSSSGAVAASDLERPSRCSRRRMTDSASSSGEASHATVTPAASRAAARLPAWAKRWVLGAPGSGGGNGGRWRRSTAKILPTE